MITVFKLSIVSKLKEPFLWLFIIIIFGLLFNFPYGAIYTSLNTIALLFLLFFYCFYTLNCIRKKKTSQLYIWLSLILLVPLYGAIKSYLIFGQPLLYGILSERLKIFAVGGLLIVYLLEEGWIKLKDVENVIFKVGTIFFILVLLLYSVIPLIAGSNYSFVVETISKGYRLNINHGLIVVLFFVSLVRTVYNFKVKYLILSLLLFFYIAFLFKARSMTLSILAVSIVFIFNNQNALKLIKIGSVVILLLLLSAFIGYFLFFEELSHIGDLFKSAFNAILGGEVIDPSSQSRISEFEIAKRGFYTNPVFGNGFLSSRFNGGFSGVYGHFYPSDIGWFGILFLYGIVGLLIYLIPFINTFYSSLKVSAKDSSFILAMRYVFLYFLIHGIVAGFVVKKIGMIFFIYSLIYFHYHRKKALQNQK